MTNMIKKIAEVLASSIFDDGYTNTSAHAQAVLQALMEPTDEMIEAMRAEVLLEWAKEDGADWAVIWRAAIKEAMKDTDE